VTEAAARLIHKSFHTFSSNFSHTLFYPLTLFPSQHLSLFLFHSLTFFLSLSPFLVLFLFHSLSLCLPISVSLSLSVSLCVSLSLPLSFSLYLCLLFNHFLSLSLLKQSFLLPFHFTHSTWLSLFSLSLSLLFFSRFPLYSHMLTMACHYHEQNSIRLFYLS
jgi:hypothetical protein